MSMEDKIDKNASHRPADLTPRPDPTDVHALAESLRLSLGLQPWEQFKHETLVAYENRAEWSKEQRQQSKKELRRTGRTTRALLYAIAEAKLLDWPLVIVSYGTGVALRARAEQLLEQLGLDKAVPIQKTSWQPCIVYVDHVMGYTARDPLTNREQEQARNRK